MGWECASREAHDATCNPPLLHQGEVLAILQHLLVHLPQYFKTVCFEVPRDARGAEHDDTEFHVQRILLVEIRRDLGGALNRARQGGGMLCRPGANEAIRLLPPSCYRERICSR